MIASLSIKSWAIPWRKITFTLLAFCIADLPVPELQATGPEEPHTLQLKAIIWSISQGKLFVPMAVHVPNDYIGEVSTRGAQRGWRTDFCVLKEAWEATTPVQVVKVGCREHIRNCFLASFTFISLFSISPRSSTLVMYVALVMVHCDQRRFLFCSWLISIIFFISIRRRDIGRRR
jgi:hypothetical protein